MQKKLSWVGVVFILIFAAVIMLSAYGFIMREWMLLKVLYLAIILFILLLGICVIISGHIVPRKKTKLSSPSDGGIDVEIICTRYMVWTAKICIDVDGTNIGEIYRGGSSHITLPKGTIQISAYSEKEKETVQEGTVENGTSLRVWSDNELSPKFHVTFVRKNEHFDEGELKESYKNARGGITDIFFFIGDFIWMLFI